MRPTEANPLMPLDTQRARRNRRGTFVDDSGRAIYRAPPPPKDSMFPCHGCAKPTTRKHEGTKRRVWCHGCWCKLPTCPKCGGKGTYPAPPAPAGVGEGGEEGDSRVKPGDPVICEPCEGTGKVGA